MPLTSVNLELHRGTTNITATWAASSTVGLGGWLLRWRAEGTLVWNTRLLRETARESTIRALTEGVRYEVELRALAAEGGATATTTTGEAEAPAEGVGVNSVPIGVPGEWHVEFADGFAVPFGTAPGENNYWFPNNSGSSVLALTHGDNPDELQAYSGSQVSVDAEGLRLRTEYSPNVGGTGKNYLAGVINGSVNTAGPGYRLFRWKPTAGQAFALEIMWKLPPNTGEMNPAFWSLDAAWTAELDHPEMWGWGHLEYFAGIPVWIYKTPSSSVRREMYKVSELGFDPTVGFHRFTTVMNADGSLDFYADGSHKWHVGPPPAEPNRPYMGMVVQNALRSNTSGYTSGFTSGHRDLQARSVAVYTDAAHAGLNVQNPGVAPGTVLV